MTSKTYVVIDLRLFLGAGRSLKEDLSVLNSLRNLIGSPTSLSAMIRPLSSLSETRLSGSCLVQEILVRSAEQSPSPPSEKPLQLTIPLPFLENGPSDQ